MTIVDSIVGAGPLSEAILQIAENDDGTVFVRTEKNTFLLALSETRVVFEAVIDIELPAQRERILAALLTYNAVWRETGSIRMALTGNGADAPPMMIAAMLINETFTSENIAIMIEDLEAKIEIWRDIIATGADDGSAMVHSSHSVKV